MIPEVTFGHMVRPLCFATLALIPHLFVAQTICQIQGSGSVSAYAGQVVTTEGVVTALFTGTGSLNGYFLEQPNCDGDDATSNGVFVYDATPSGVAVGLRLSVTATVTEFNGVTELINPNVQVLGPGSVVPTDLSLPLATANLWERYEGMLLRFTATLMVTDNSSLYQYGELVLAPHRLFTPTDLIDPNDAVASGTTSSGQSNVGAVNAEFDLIDRSVIVLDDGRTNTYPSPTPWVGPAGTLRTGSTVTGLTAVLHYSYGAYRLEPVGSNQVVPAERPLAPELGDGLRAASLNVLNYFTTLGDWGAQNADELGRQRTKLVAAIEAMDPDVLALCEVENDDAAWMDLLDALNAEVGAGTYGALEEDGFGGGTRSVVFYKPAVLETCTPLYSLNTGIFQRPHLTQGFISLATGGRFLFSTMHLRSKLCDNATGTNLDQGDGQGCYNTTRKAQVSALITHWSDLRTNSGISAQLIMGDFNAYSEEDPLDLLRSAELQDLMEIGDHSYLYQGLAGALDHAFGTSSMSSSTLVSAVWHINSDEPAALDYSDANISRYQPNAFRCSDHDPVLVGFSEMGLSVGSEEVVGAMSIQFLLNEQLAQWVPNGVDPGLMDLFIVDARGSLVHTRTIRSGETVDLTPFAPGIYLWHLTDPSAGKPVGLGRFVLP